MISSKGLFVLESLCVLVFCSNVSSWLKIMVSRVVGSVLVRIIVVLLSVMFLKINFLSLLVLI